MISKIVKVDFVDFDPYGDLSEMIKDISDNKRLRITKLNNNSRLLPGDVNLKFRAIHDFLHYIHNREFTFDGEFDVYNIQKEFHKSDIGKKLMYSEIVLQTAYHCHFGKFPDKQKVIIN